jgi:hypothetical protein
VAVDGFVASTAIAGGVALVVGAEALKFPADVLAGTPFRNYVIPGLILAVMVGGSATVGLITKSLSPRTGALASSVAGAILMGWILGEVLLLPPSQRSVLEAFYFAVGLAMAGLGLIVNKGLALICFRVKPSELLDGRRGDQIGATSCEDSLRFPSRREPRSSDTRRG